jgi:hypothetical protein
MASELIERDMYNSKFRLVHNPNARGSKPRYVLIDKETGESTKPKGCTTILGQTLSKDLMAWAVACAVEYLNAKLPNIAKVDIEDASHEYERRRDSGAGTGTEAHALVENYLKGLPVDLATASKEAALAFGAFVKWFDGSKPEVINVEEVIYSEKYNFAGTYDCMLRIDGKVYLCDLKTTNASRKAPNGVYAENFIQLGAYALAHEEQREYEEANGGTMLEPIEGLLVISSKKNGKFDLVSNDDLGLSVEVCGKRFTEVVTIYNFMQNNTKLLGGR